MKVLLLSWNYPPVLGGIEVVVESLFEGLRRQGHEVRLVTAWAEGAPNDPDIFRSPKRGLKRFVRYSLTRGLSVCRKERPEVIVCGSLVGAPAAYVLSRVFGLPFVVLVHGSDILRRGWIYQRATRFLLKRAARVAANSAHTRRLLQSLGVDERRVDVIHPGVRVEDISGSEAAGADEYEGRRVLLSVGRLVRRKGLLEFVQHVMPSLVRENPKALLLVVGDDATASLVHPERMRRQIEAKVAEMELQEHVKLLGNVPQDELTRLLHRAEVFVMPALEIRGDVEGFGIVIVEAALAGVPSVASRVGGVPEAVEDGATGLLVEAGDYGAMAGAIGRLLKDEHLRRTMGQAAAQRAKDRFAWDAIVGQYEQMMKRCLG